ncbi:putative HEAT repeat containing 6 [Operophtera brumata]|uniref:HEAT repeat-containing protein 6 n=1 Tax=Operophtera brumata TaxID=104452 RepID=A0A0L7LJ10_OPEBR|nr:putative HEAT repeat containing 6 [Operophtera brumata]
MDSNLSQQFSLLCGELCNLLYLKEYNKSQVNALIDELNSKPFKGELFVRKHDASTVVTALCHNIKPGDEFISAKTSHLINSILIKQNIQFPTDFLWKVVLWHVECLRKCSDIILPDILHNMQCILQANPLADTEKPHTLSNKNPLQICLIALKCIVSLVSTTDEAKNAEDILKPEVKKQISQVVVNLLMSGSTKSQDVFLYCKVVISALRVLSQLYFNDQNVEIPLPEVMGISWYFALYGLVNLESLKKEIPVCDRSLKKDVDSFENNSAYKPASCNYLEPQRAKNCWALTSDSDVSDMESSGEAKLIALKSRVRQSASNLLLVLVKMFGYWWALLPDSPDPSKWLTEDSAKKTLAYCAVVDPIASSRASVLSVILALLSGSRIYLSQAETSKKDNASFIPFSTSLGYIITCMHRVLNSILEAERSHAVILVALKCCAALVQATPYHKMKEGLISELVKSARKFLIHRVGALITMGCVLSIDTKKDEVLKSIDKDTVFLNINTSQTPNLNMSQTPNINISQTPNTDLKSDGDCDDFEEGYSDDEMFTAVEQSDKCVMAEATNYFSSWILDISVAFHHLPDLLSSHITLLGDILCEMLQYEHQDVTLVTPLSTVLQCHENSPAKAVVCDCIANIGEKSFKELPVLCCTLLVGSCSDMEATVRAAAVRALAMAVMFRTLREVRTHLIYQRDDPECEDIDDDLLLRLLQVSIQCAADNDKVKMSATRGLGNLLRLIKNENLVRKPQMKTLCEAAIGKLLDCTCKVTNMKVRWNACYAMGNAMKNDQLFTCFNGWQSQVYPNLSTLAQECKNLKVRINACVALRAPSQRTHYGEHYTLVWRDLADILDPLSFHCYCAKSLFLQVCRRLPPENASCLKILQAAKYVTVDLTSGNESQTQALAMLQDIFIWDL